MRIFGQYRSIASGRRLVFPMVFAGALLLASQPAQSGSLEVVSSDGQMRTVSHELGQARIPVDPQRLVTLHNIFAEALLVCGKVPVGTIEHGRKLPSHLAEALKGVRVVGQQTTPDFETILSLQPDLILATATEHGQAYPLLNAIAPTLLVDEPKEDWREWFLATGQALGCAKPVADAIAAYDQRASEVKGRLKIAHAGETVLVLRVREKDIRVYGGARRSGQVLFRDLGMEPHSLVPLEENNVTVSNEIIPQLTADHIFLMVEDTARMQGLQATTLWQSLPAVKNGHVYEVDIEPWNQSSGPISFGRIVDDVARLIADKQ